MSLRYRLKIFLISFTLTLSAYLPVRLFFVDLPLLVDIGITTALFFCSTLISTIIETNAISKLGIKAKDFLLDRYYEEDELDKKNELQLLREFTKYCTSRWDRLEELVETGDITSRLEEMELTRARRMALFEGAAYPIFIIDASAKIIDVNKELAYLVSYDEGRLEGSEVRFILPDNNVLDRLLGAMESQTFWQGGTELLTAKGEFIPVKLRVTKIEAENVKLIQIFVDDLRELREREKELERKKTQIEKFDKIIVNREMRMIELKKENERLKKLIKKARK